MACVCSRSNGSFDWLTVRHYSSVMSMDRLRACKHEAKTHTRSNLLTSNVRSLQENLKPRPYHIDFAVAWSKAWSRFEIFS